MLEQLVMGLKGRSWVLILPLIAVLALAACSPTPAPAPVEIEKEATKEVAKEAPAAVETEVVVLELAKVIETPVPVEVEDRQPLQLDVVDEAGRLHFRLEIDADDYPPGNDFKLEVMAIPREKIAEICQDQQVCKEYPEVSGVEDGRLIILVDSEKYVTASPYVFSVTGIDQFDKPVSVSTSVDNPPEDHGIIIYHEDDRTIEHFPAKLIQEGDFFWVASSDDPDDPDYYAPIYRCCREHGH